MSRADGGQAGWLMIKLVYCFAKRPDLSVEEFARYLHEVHASIGLRIPGLRRLVQSVAIHDPRDAHQPSFDGMAELWFDNVEDVLRARESAEWRASTEDERHFIDHSRTAYFLSRELVLPEPASSARRAVDERARDAARDDIRGRSSASANGYDPTSH